VQISDILISLSREAMALSYINSSAVRSSFFAQRGINVWNSLPSSVDFGTLSAFKRLLQCVNLNEF